MDTNDLFQSLLQMGAIKRPQGRPAVLKDHTLRIRISQQQLERLENYALERGISMSDVIRKYIDRLPNSKME